jgi:hypothetical protein
MSTLLRNYYDVEQICRLYDLEVSDVLRALFAVKTPDPDFVPNSMRGRVHITQLLEVLKFLLNEKDI